MKLIEDLGMQYQTEHSKYKKRFGIYECPICNKPFRCPTSAVRNGYITRCKPCSCKSATDAKIKEASDSFVAKALTVHGNKYSYTLLEYLGRNIKVQIICQTHGIFLQTPNGHLRGQGCPDCAFDRGNIALRMSVTSCKPVILYYVYFKEHNLWKIGCTTRSIEKRFKDDNTCIEVLFLKTYEDSREAYFVEGWILKSTLDTKTTSRPLKSGNSELRYEPVDNLLTLIQGAEVMFTRYH